MSLANQIRRGLASIASFALLAGMAAAYGEPARSVMALDDSSVAACDVPPDEAVAPVAQPAAADSDDDVSHVSTRPNWRTLLPSVVLRTRT